VRDLRSHHDKRRRGRRGGPAAHDGRHDPPGPRRVRPVPAPGLRAVRGAWASPALHHRSDRDRPPAAFQRRRHRVARLQRRDLQPRRAPQGDGGQGPPLPLSYRQRGHRPSLRGRGGSLREAARGHVRLRPLGRKDGGARVEPRPHRHQAPRLPARRRHAALRLGDPVDPAAPRRGEADRLGGPRALPHVQLHPRPLEHLPGHPEAPAGADPLLSGRGPERDRILEHRPQA